MKKISFSVSRGSEFRLFILPCKNQADHHQTWGTPGKIQLVDMNVYFSESSDLLPSSGVKSCTLIFSENIEAIHFITCFVNLITRPHSGCRCPWGCKSGSYTPVIQCDLVLGKRLHPRWL